MYDVNSKHADDFINHEEISKRSPMQMRIKIT